MASQGLRGFVGQSMSGIKPSTFPTLPTAYNFGAGSYSFSPPMPGLWKFIGWGPGGSNVAGVSSGASGGYVEISKRLTTVDVVALVVGKPGTDTTITLPNTTAATAGAASGATGGTATGGDVNTAGTAGGGAAAAAGPAGTGTGGGAGGAAGGTNDGGAGAPGVLPYRGGIGGAADVGGTGAAQTGGFPGGGAGGHAATVYLGGQGLVLAVYMG